MKLRSGKIIKQPLPAVLREKLEADLEDLQVLLANNKEFTLDMVKLIVNAPSSATVRHEITNLIEENFNDINMIDGKGQLYKDCGSLLLLITGEHSLYQKSNIPTSYHDTIQQIIMESFDISQLIGDFQNLNLEE